MKLRTRLILGMVLLLVLSLGVCCTLMILSVRQVIMEEAVAYTAEESSQLVSDFTACIRKQTSQDWRQDSALEKTILCYYFRQVAGNYDRTDEYVLQREGEILYNNSGINVETALDGGRTVSEDDETGSFRSRVVHIDGKDCCVVGSACTFGKEILTIAVVRDISENMSQVRTLALRCILICGGVSALAAILAALLLTGGLRPVEALRREAASVAQGNYDSRIRLSRRDELGELAESFNRMAEAVQEHVRRVEETSGARNLLLHALAHEMRTPATAISGYAYALGHARMSREQQEEAIGFLDSESRRLARLSSKLTELVMVGDRQTELETVETAGLRETLWGILRPRAEEWGEEVSFDMEEGRIRGDADLLVVMVTNLFDNARKAGAGRVRIALRDGRLSVSDDGCGIPAEQVEKITQPFYQGDSSRNREGFGLGLALCERIAALHGSALTVESAPGKGSTFSITFYNSFTDS